VRDVEDAVRPCVTDSPNSAGHVPAAVPVEQQSRDVELLGRHRERIKLTKMLDTWA
jgi:hypothetical protein